MGTVKETDFCLEVWLVWPYFLASSVLVTLVKAAATEVMLLPHGLVTGGGEAAAVASRA